MQKAFIFLCILTTFISCVTVVQDELDAMPPEPVLNGILQPDSTAWVHLSFSSTFSEVDFKAIENARVMLYVDGVLFEELEHQYDGLYIGSIPLSTDVLYECIAEIPNYGMLKAADIIPQAIIFENEYTDYGVPNTEGNSQPRLNLKIIHDPTIDSFFDLAIFQSFSFNPYFRAQMVAPFDRVIIDEGVEAPLFSNQYMEVTPYSFQAHTFVYEFGCTNFVCSSIIPPTIIELRTISYHLYRYLQQGFLQEREGLPEFGIGMPAPINSYSNVENGRGIFAAYSFVRSDTIPPPPRPY